jgi:hypothetical protein
MTNRLVTLSSLRDRRVRNTDVKIGDPIYAIQDVKTRLYFIWAYTDIKMAEWIRTRVTPGSDTDIAANWRRKVGEVVPTDTSCPSD